ncbi:MAG TPA: DUF5312 family protein [Magnetospirillaceae bacterium]|nr:DUF5312 family protein [Magnetospirillaceae bacterium]
MSETFDRLVRGLSVQERTDLLDRIQASAGISEEPLFRQEAVREPPVDYSTRYNELNSLTRILILFRRIFTGKSRDVLVKEVALRSLARRIEAGYPGLVSYARRVFLGQMLEEMRGLRDAARFFYDLLDRTIEREKGAFYAFLGSLELADQHKRLLTETDPYQLASADAVPEDPEIRIAILATFEDILLSIPEEGRRRMYADVRSLTFLRRVAGFLYDRLFSCFEETPAGLQESSFAVSRELMAELADCLYSMSSPPSLRLLESLFVFRLRDEMENPDFDAENALKTRLIKAEESLSRIRLFNARVPLHGILRLVLEDPNYRPRELAGGEDWFANYKGFWKDRIERLLAQYSVDRRLKDLYAGIAAFLGPAEPARFRRISEGGGEGVPPVRLERALVFLAAFHSRHFIPEMNRHLKVLLIEGEFYRKDNRVEFTDAYNTLLRVPETLAALDGKLDPEGSLSAAYVQAREEIVSISVKRRKVQTALQAANEEAEGILNRSRDAMKKMQAILKGILLAEAGGRYDSLANLHQIDGKANRDFLRGLDSVRNRLEQAVYFLDKLDILGAAREPA